MEIIFLALTIFLLSFTLLFPWIYKTEKRDRKEAGIWRLVGTSIGIGLVLALFITVIITFLFLVLVGSTKVLNSLFSLHISGRALFWLALCFFLYLFTLDHIFGVAVELLIGKNVLSLIFLTIVRMIAFYLIGIFFHFKHTENLIIAIGVTLFVCLFDVYDLLKERKEA